MRVVVDSNDDRAILHTSDVLDLTRNTASDIEFRAYGNTSLTNLTFMFAETSIHRSTRSTHFATKHRCQFIQHIEALCATHAVATSHHDRRTFDVQFRFLHVAFNHLNYEVLIAHIFSYVEATHFAFIISIQHLFFHHTLAHSRHLRTAIRVDDSSHDVTTKRRADLVQQVFVSLVVFLIFKLANFEHSTVGSQTTKERRRDTRTQVATHRCSTHQCNLRLFLLKQIHDNARMRQCSIILQTRVFGNSQAVNAIREHLFAHRIKTITNCDSLQLATQLRSQSATFGQKFKTHLSHLTIFYFEIYKYVLHNTYKFILFLFRQNDIRT